MILKKNNQNLTHRQNTLPFNLDDDKYRTPERCKQGLTEMLTK